MPPLVHLLNQLNIVQKNSLPGLKEKQKPIFVGMRSTWCSNLGMQTSASNWHCNHMEAFINLHAAIWINYFKTAIDGFRHQ